MDPHLSSWLDLILRWVHVITGAAWIGTSFYFNWLNNHVRESDGLEDGVAGDLWSVHGGHFYRVVKYRVAPERLPKVLHWFKWEAYFTWISGFCLLGIAYYLKAGSMVVDRNVRELGEWAATGIGVGVLAVGWLVYHFAWRSALGRKPVLLTMLGFVAFVGVSWWLTTMFNSRAAYIHVGALIGTIMAANVFFVIIPNQRVMVDAMTRGEEPAAQLGIDAAIRSRHNNYLTLPMLFIMVSNHYPMTFGHEWNWAILAGLSICGAGVRHWFNLRGMGEKNVWLLPAAAVGMVALAFVTKPASFDDHPPVEFAEIRELVDMHCIQCHSATPSSELFAVAPKGVKYDTSAEIGLMAGAMNSQIQSRVMPLSNMTDMTQAERAMFGAWFAQGAKVE